MNRPPIAITSFDRPHYLVQVLESLRAQSTDIDEFDLHLFQDGAVNKSSGVRYANDEKIASAISSFQQAFPAGTVHAVSDNIGIAENRMRAERLMFEEKNEEWAIFLEDDLVLDQHYLANLLTLIQSADDRRIAYLSCYSPKLLTQEEQRNSLHGLRMITHSWGVALRGQAWQEMVPMLEEYLDVVRGDYRQRDAELVYALYREWGMASRGTSQDSAHHIAATSKNWISLMTVASHARYIGEHGVHFSSRRFSEGGFAMQQTVGTRVERFAVPSNEKCAKMLRNRRSQLQQAVHLFARSADCPQYLYAGNCFADSWHYKAGYTGLALHPKSDRDIPHDMTDRLPFPAESCERFQSEDVFEHIDYEKLANIFADIYRILKPSGLFRMSVPDYRSQFLRDRSVYDSKGKIVFDPGGGGFLNSRLEVENGGHVWFPTIETVRALFEASPFTQVAYREFWDTDGSPVNEAIDYAVGHIRRTAAHDPRAAGKPLSIVVDAIK